MELSRSYDLGCEFCKLAVLTQIFFFSQLHNSTLDFLRIEIHNFLWDHYGLTTRVASFTGYSS